MIDIIFDPKHNTYNVLFRGSIVFSSPFKQMASEFATEFKSFLQL